MCPSTKGAENDNSFSGIDKVSTYMDYQHGKSKVKLFDGVCWKLVSPSTAGVPDRIILMPNCRIAFVELKALGKGMRPLQVHRKKQLETLGFRVYCIDRKEQIVEVLNEIQAT